MVLARKKTHTKKSRSLNFANQKKITIPKRKPGDNRAIRLVEKIGHIKLEGSRGFSAWRKLRVPATK